MSEINLAFESSLADTSGASGFGGGGGGGFLTVGSITTLIASSKTIFRPVCVSAELFRKVSA